MTMMTMMTTISEDGGLPAYRVRMKNTIRFDAGTDMEVQVQRQPQPRFQSRSPLRWCPRGSLCSGSPLLFLLRSPPWWGLCMWRWQLLRRRCWSCSPPCLSLRRQSPGRFPCPHHWRRRPSSPPQIW
ncbi:hypothetical protein AAFF_G00382980 [Aldrovandia affinis]|uniref:Uncharacterized protein n=1 Tax=Aldrovandia affinis TaxID=143900 RepID=A0AAD7X091_9TELE|nr:hypothetical protein AAFF_G00382980 [Aldrovandia affinis]